MSPRHLFFVSRHRSFTFRVRLQQREFDIDVLTGQPTANSSRYSQA
ncbi:hypothetical protein [Actinobaculum sp. 313]|nr:hypothetical protein [Actinobaculum sp. 313]